MCGKVLLMLCAGFHYSSTAAVINTIQHHALACSSLCLHTDTRVARITLQACAKPVHVRCVNRFAQLQGRGWSALFVGCVYMPTDST